MKWQELRWGVADYIGGLKSAKLPTAAIWKL
jgi:hypothetical protein